MLALDVDDREALLRAMEDWCPPELAELRAVLIEEHVGRVRDGLALSQAPRLAGRAGRYLSVTTTPVRVPSVLRFLQARKRLPHRRTCRCHR